MLVTANPLVLKLLLVFAHLLGTSLALGAIMTADIRLLRRLAGGCTRIAAPQAFLKSMITAAFLVLCATGGALIVLGLQSDPTYLSGNPKLQAKLMLVAALAANALVLHYSTFPAIARSPCVVQWKFVDFTRIVLPVALSNSLWMYCAFLGIARAWNQTISLGFVLGCAAWLFAAMLTGITAVLLVAARACNAPPIARAL